MRANIGNDVVEIYAEGGLLFADVRSPSGKVAHIEAGRLVELSALRIDNRKDWRKLVTTCNVVERYSPTHNPDGVVFIGVSTVAVLSALTALVGPERALELYRVVLDSRRAAGAVDRLSLHIGGREWFCRSLRGQRYWAELDRRFSAGGEEYEAARVGA